MSDPTTRRVIAEAALAKRFETEINERASLADIPALVGEVDRRSNQGVAIALDDDGVPYINIGDE